ncbi:MAG TPA: amidohydrolase family protein [Candidatus Dormibacteraeota bacterium]|nr:amidohydrolase family protein [Candidatus Dormibacteraeota bacterium]
MRTITLEEHFASPAFIEGPGRAAARPGLVESLLDVGDGRIEEMDAAGVDVQVLSLAAPGVEQMEAGESVAMARETNDYLAEAVRRHPQRLAGFAALPTPDPEAAARELDRTVGQLGFLGAVVNGHSRGRYLDDPFFDPILERAEALDAPLYLHPAAPPKAVVDASYGGFSPEVVFALSTSGWGWHIETAVHVLRLIVGGVFDRHPRLQILIGHMGEALPFMLPRFDLSMPPELTGIKRPISAYLRENVHYTFSGFNWTPNLLDLLLQVGVDRIMFSADHPYRSMAEAVAFLEGAPLSPADQERIAHGNAERLLRLEG